MLGFFATEMDLGREIAKLRKSTTEKRDPEKHLSLRSRSTTEAREQNSATEVGVSLVV